MDNNRILYLDCASGISGDMFAAAMIDLGADREILRRALDSIPTGGFRTEIRRVKKQSIDCCDFRVILDEDLENHDADMEYLFGRPDSHEIEEAHRYAHGEAHGYAHGEAHGHDHGEAHSHGHEYGEAHGCAHGEAHSHGDGGPDAHCQGNAHNHEETHIHEGLNAHGHNHDHHGHDYGNDINHGHDNHSHDYDSDINHSHALNHDHDYGNDINHGHDNHSHDHNHEHDHGHSHHHDHGHNYETPHVHRTLQDVREILSACEMTDRAREIADRIFVILARAEAKAHGTTPDQVHFHEVGAVDSIVDIVTAAVCFDALQVSRVYVSPMFEGSGTIRCAHGLLPVPVPAVANIITASALRLSVDSTVKGEFITPTGAAIAAALVTETALPADFQVLEVGLGAGKRDYERLNYLRAMLIQTQADHLPAEKNEQTSAGGSDGEEIFKLETDLDDCTGETLGYTLERLLDAGARDAHYLPVYMKKNRPAWQLQVICDADKVRKMEDIIFAETTSIGIRRIRVERTILPREIRSVQTRWGEAKVKVCLHNGAESIYPEYESAARIARETGLPYSEVFQEIKKAAGK
ncbi:MAG: nickel pincer cofactor biosynthesis protein LarC [Eubacterium sp.]|nr:nickel pincer cofactor biosynthesis protein LarC [Eubacterium sp.]